MKTITDYLRKKKSAIIPIAGYDIQFELEGRFLAMEFDGQRYVCNAYSPDVESRIQTALEDVGIEIRFCEICGKPYDAGYTVDDGSWYCCEECFKPTMDKDYGKGNWRGTDEEGDCGGFYECLIDGEWEDTGIYWTEWN